MSIPDDPFAETTRTGGVGGGGRARGGSSPSPVTSTTTTTPPSLRVPPAAATTGSASGTRTPRRVQWTTDQVSPPSLDMARSSSSPAVELGGTTVSSSLAASRSSQHRARAPLPPALRVDPMPPRTDRPPVVAIDHAEDGGGTELVVVPQSPTHTLDEDNFEQVRTALERHQSQSSGGSARAAGAAAANGGSARKTRRSRVFHMSLTDQESEGETERADQLGDLGRSTSRLNEDVDDDDHDDDYDYRRDLRSRTSSIVDMSEMQDDDDGDRHGSAPYTPGETFGAYNSVHPSAVNARHPEHEAQQDEEAPEQQQDLYRQMPVYVDAGETDGLPNLANVVSRSDQQQQGGGGDATGSHGNTQIADDAQAEASALIRAHRSGRFGGFLRNRKQGFSKGVSTITGSRSKDPEKGGAAASKEDPRTTTGLQPGMGMAHGVGKVRPSQGIGGAMMGASLGGTGVLAGLLSLYDQAGASGASTPASHPNSLAPSSDESSDEEERRRRRDRKRMKEELKRRDREAKEAKAAAKRARGASASSQGTQLPRRSGDPTSPLEGPNSPPMLSPPLTHAHRTQSGTSLSEMGKRTGSQLYAGVRKAADRLGIDVDDRPKQARSGAGVFGALMQSTGNITGAAAPAQSTLVPAAKRPGYRLSRYSNDGTQAAAAAAPTSPVGSTFNVPPPMSRPASMYEAGEVGAIGGSPSSSSGTRVEDNLVALGRAQTTDDRQLRSNNATARPTHIELPGRDQTRKSGGMLRSFGSGTHLPLTPGEAVRSAGNWIKHGGRSQPGTPPSEYGSEKGYFSEKMARQLSEDEIRRREWEKEKKRRKKAKEKKKQQEIFIIQHVAAVLARQQFLLKLARAFMMFGSPSHRFEAQIQATARVLDLNAQCISLPGMALISFNDESTHTSEAKIIKQATGLDLGKLLATHYLYWNVTHDKMSAEDASKELDGLMTSKPHYSSWEMLVIGGMCSSFIGGIAFNASFIDVLISFPLGCLLIAVQLIAAKNDLYSNIFEISVSALFSFIAAALSSSGYFCYTAVASSSIVLILPGYIVLSGSLELASRNITSGAVRIGYAVIYSLFLGFGLSIGATVYQRITGHTVTGAEDYTCATAHPDGSPWWRETIPPLWYILFCPGYCFWLSLRQSQPIMRVEMPVMVLFGSAGWVVNHFSSQAFPGRADITSLLGSFTVGVLGNLWGRFHKGSSFVVMLVGILFQLPSGLGNGGLFNFAAESNSGNSDSYSSGFQVAQQLVQVAIGLTVGLFLSAAVTHPFGTSRRSGGGGIFSF